MEDVEAFLVSLVRPAAVHQHVALLGLAPGARKRAVECHHASGRKGALRRFLVGQCEGTGLGEDPAAPGAAASSATTVRSAAADGRQVMMILADAATAAALVAGRPPRAVNRTSTSAQRF